MARPSITTSVTRPSSTLEVDAVEITNTPATASRVTVTMSASITKALFRSVSAAVTTAFSAAVDVAKNLAGATGVTTAFSAAVDVAKNLAGATGVTTAFSAAVDVAKTTSASAGITVSMAASLVRNFLPSHIDGYVLGVEAWNESLTYLGAVTAVTDRSPTGATIAQGVGSNQPKGLPWDVSTGNYFHLPPASGNYLRSSSSFIPATGTVVRIQLHFQPNVITTHALVSMYTVAGNYCWYLRRASNTYELITSPDGNLPITTVTSGTITSGSYHLRLVWTVASGAVTFEESADGTAWSLLSTTGTAVVPYAGSTSTLDIGAVLGGSGSLKAQGRSHYVRIYEDDVLVRDCEADDANAASTSWVSANSTAGETWTLTATGTNPAMIVSHPAILFDTDDVLLITGAGLAIFQNVAAAYIVAAIRPAGTTAQQGLVYFSGAISAAGRAVITLNAGNSSLFGRAIDGGTSTTLVGEARADRVSFVHSGLLSFGAGTLANYTNGVSVSSGALAASANTSNTASGYASIGDLLGSGYFSGTAMAVYAFASVPTAQNITDLQAYIAAQANVGGTIY